MICLLYLACFSIFAFLADGQDLLAGSGIDENYNEIDKPLLLKTRRQNCACVNVPTDYLYEDNPEQQEPLQKIESSEINYDCSCNLPSNVQRQRQELQAILEKVVSTQKQRCECCEAHAYNPSPRFGLRRLKKSIKRSRAKARAPVQQQWECACTLQTGQGNLQDSAQTYQKSDYGLLSDDNIPPPPPDTSYNYNGCPPCFDIILKFGRPQQNLAQTNDLSKYYSPALDVSPSILSPRSTICTCTPITKDSLPAKSFDSIPAIKEYSSQLGSNAQVPSTRSTMFYSGQPAKYDSFNKAASEITSSRYSSGLIQPAFNPQSFSSSKQYYTPNVQSSLSSTLRQPNGIQTRKTQTAPCFLVKLGGALDGQKYSLRCAGSDKQCSNTNCCLDDEKLQADYATSKSKACSNVDFLVELLQKLKHQLEV